MSVMTKPLANKIAVVTGGSRGIGRAIAATLAADGALVGVHYGKNATAAEAVVAEIKDAGGDNCNLICKGFCHDTHPILSKRASHLSPANM